MELQKLTIEELMSLKSQIEIEIQNRSENKTQEVWLEYNQYKGSGKCWIANVDENGKVIYFLSADVNQKDGYRGRKLFKVPLIEGKRYKLVESGSKSRDDSWYVKVINGVLEKN